MKIFDKGSKELEKEYVNEMENFLKKTFRNELSKD